jgi:hypothetical protein
MENIKEKIEAFFKAYEKRFEEGLGGEPDIKATRAAFASCFVESSPVGVNCGKNDEEFDKAIPQGYDFYRSIGTTGMTVSSLNINELHPNHYAVKVQWKSVYKKRDGAEITIEFEVVYLLRHFDNELKIFAYITGDEQGELKKYGLVE